MNLYFPQWQAGAYRERLRLGSGHLRDLLEPRAGFETVPTRDEPDLPAVDGVKGKQITLWGCAFKPETDDIRESPAVRLATALLERGAVVVAHDPEAGPNFAKHFIC